MSYPHAPGTLARKLLDETPTVVPAGSGVPGWVRIRTYDPGTGAFAVSRAMARERVSTTLHDPYGLLTRPDTSD